MQAFNKFTSDVNQKNKQEEEFKFDEGSQSLPSDNLVRSQAGSHKQKRKAGPNIHPDAARTLHDIVFTRLRHSHSFHKDSEEVK